MKTTPIVSHSTRTISMPRFFLHLEGLVLLAGALFLYADLGFSWLAFALLLFVPDVSLFLYPFAPHAASMIYNLLHSLVLPLAVFLYSYFTGQLLGTQLALIWLVHIGMDRALGYGLKYLGSFTDTHLSNI